MIRAHIREPYTGLSSIEVVIANHLDANTVHVMHLPEDGGVRWDPYDDTAAPPKPTLVLPVETGRVLLDALTLHYQGAEDTRALRRDYDAERRRVDEQAKVIADVVRSLAAKGGAA